jgi:hypothetical protein
MCVKSFEYSVGDECVLERDEMIVVISLYFGYFWKGEELDKSVGADAVYIFNNIKMIEYNNISNIMQSSK